jgi:hypothetical protein
MIHYLNPTINYTPRPYLNQWFKDDVVLITDNDYYIPETVQLLEQWPTHQRITDLTHNAMPDQQVTIASRLVLTADYTNWYTSKTNFVFFPLYLWAFNQKNILWFGNFGFDADHNKTKPIMCLNNNLLYHRRWLYEEFQNLEIIDQMVYTWQGERTLPNDNFGEHRIGVHHPVYSECAVNLVTETEMTTCSLSEKSCKPFMALQIPVIVGPPGCNKFLQDIGFDMFSDLVPWNTWDTEQLQEVKLKKISQFVTQWILSGTILSDYYQVLSRVQYNKQHFHSETLRNCIMNQMHNLV